MRKILQISFISILLLLFSDNEVLAMERSTEQKMDSDLLRDMSDASFEMMFEQFINSLSPERRVIVNEQMNAIVANLVDRVEDSELNLPNQQGIRGYESILIFIVGSIIGYILFRHGSYIFDVMREVAQTSIDHLIPSLDTLRSTGRLIAYHSPRARSALIDLINAPQGA